MHNDEYYPISNDKLIRSKTILIVHYNSEWNYDNNDHGKGGFGNHELHVIYEKNGDILNKKLTCHITLRGQTSYWLNLDDIKYTDFDKNMLYLIQEIILLFNLEPERSIEHRYRIINYCHKYINKCVMLDQIIVYTYSSMIDHKDYRIIDKQTKCEL